MRSFDMGEIPALLYFKPGTQLFVRRLNMSGARCRAALRPWHGAYRLALPRWYHPAQLNAINASLSLHSYPVTAGAPPAPAVVAHLPCMPPGCRRPC
jgi:hypothetical protein